MFPRGNVAGTLTKFHTDEDCLRSEGRSFGQSLHTAMTHSLAIRLTLFFSLIAVATATSDIDSEFSVIGNPALLKRLPNGAVRMLLTNDSGSAGTTPSHSFIHFPPTPTADL